MTVFDIFTEQARSAVMAAQEEAAVPAGRVSPPGSSRA